VKPFSVHPGDPIFDPTANPSFVMPGLVPGIRVLILHPTRKTWMHRNSFPESRSSDYFAQVG
jgi:hypothetical protein